ncbi:MAG: prepilin-type N-terminal cleavage/methylation domain-containing protein [Endomicrobium sp.]|jgi:prepilin-type N-terminal cleavage/methylation domain-containing protein|nr:prepilin-type N-terminal cleavage/methylation domain-containing protein [Endomicrobium sp.]
MNNQKGMTLIEVMVAMLVLSITMIGGISFFTSAYRINYAYMESANRIDHALRYVEKLKIQRRDYPTFGAFANSGGNGFTAFFVDSEFNDDYSADPYFYENYFSGTIRIPATFTTSSFPTTNSKTMINGTQQPTGYYYWDEASKIMNSTAPYTGDLVSTDYPSNDYHKYRISLAFEDAYASNTPLKVGVSGIVDYYLNYHYNGTGTEFSDAYSETTFTKMANFAKQNKYSSIYDNNRKMHKYNQITSLSTMFSTSNISFYIFPSGIKQTTIKTPVSLREENINNSSPGYYVTPYSYFSVYGGSSGSKAYGYYYKQASPSVASPILLKKGSVQENTGESSSLIGNESFSFDSRRFYRSYPSETNQDEIVELRDKVSSIYTSYTYKDYDDVNKTVLQTPDPAAIGNANLYHKDALYVALVYKGDATGKEQIHYLYYWNYYPGSGSIPGYVTPYNTYAYAAYFKLLPSGEINQRRFTKYRRSVYISVWPFNSDAQARTAMRNAIAYSQDLNARINYIKDQAGKTPGQRMIVIPFIQLYADNDNSTLCEAL